ncbi:hypothetical protein [Rivularia sp. PCC 7116]|uniref:hypothetical protein n=1 Tax=Rivularia sp. PCC 7116 TaxID=373994 RepID=UPI0003055E50|nr:hypothetical protein [Rivularia sp. PCC 7116]
MGDVQTPSYGARNNSFGVVRENCKNTECDEQPIKQETAGGTLRQLANEVREQLAYHESQIELQRNRLKRLETLIQEEDLDKPS